MPLYKLVIRLSLGLALTAGALVPALAAGPTGLLNDTGQVFCDNGSNFMQCCDSYSDSDSDSDSGDDAAPMPRQDARWGRDRAPPNKVGGGAADSEASNTYSGVAERVGKKLDLFAKRVYVQEGLDILFGGETPAEKTLDFLSLSVITQIDRTVC